MISLDLAIYMFGAFILGNLNFFLTCLICRNALVKPEKQHQYIEDQEVTKTSASNTQTISNRERQEVGKVVE